MNVEGKSRPLQFTMQSVMFAMVLLGFAIANWRLVLAFASGLFWATTLAIAYAFFFIGRSTRSLLVPPSSGIFRRSLARAMLFVSLCTSATILWARHRWFGWFYDSYWPPKTFPYPDAMLAAFHNWIDATFPAPDGYLKIHGEFYSVLICLNGAAWLACACFGFYFGLLYRIVVPIGFRRWRNRMVKFTQTATEPSDIANGFAIDDSHTVIPWRVTPEQLARITGPNALTEVTRGYYVTRCSVLGGMQVSLGFHFQGRTLRQLEFFRHFTMPLAESYADFQEHLESTFGLPTLVTEADCGYNYCEWRLGGITITHSVVDRFGPEEHVRISI